MGPPLPLVFPWLWEGTGGRPAGRGHVSAGHGLQQWRGTLFGGWRHLRSRNPPSWQGRRVLHTSGCASGHSHHASVNVSSSLRLHWARDARVAATDRQTPALCTTHVLYSGPVAWGAAEVPVLCGSHVRRGRQQTPPATWPTSCRKTSGSGRSLRRSRRTPCRPLPERAAERARAALHSASSRASARSHGTARVCDEPSTESGAVV